MRLKFPDPIRIQDAVDILGYSRSEITQRIREGIYPAIQDFRGWYWLSRSAVEKMAPEHRKHRKPLVLMTAPPVIEKIEKDEEDMAARPEPVPQRIAPTYSGEEAKKVFFELKAGLSIEDIVMKLGMHPEVVIEITATWHRIKRQIVLRADVVKEIEKLPLPGTLPIETDTQLAIMLKKAFEMPTPCARCAREKARFCTSCAIPMQAMTAMAPSTEEKKPAA